MIITDMPLPIRIAEIVLALIATAILLRAGLPSAKNKEHSYLLFTLISFAAMSVLFYLLSKTSLVRTWSEVEPKDTAATTSGMIPMMLDMMAIATYAMLVGNIVLLIVSISRAALDHLRGRKPQPQEEGPA